MITPSKEQKTTDSQQGYPLATLESEIAERLRQIMEHNRLELQRLQAAYLKSFTEAKGKSYRDQDAPNGPVQ